MQEVEKERRQEYLDEAKRRRERHATRPTPRIEPDGTALTQCFIDGGKRPEEVKQEKAVDRIRRRLGLTEAKARTRELEVPAAKRAKADTAVYEHRARDEARVTVQRAEGEEAGDDESFERFKDETEGNLSKVRGSVWPETQVGTDVQRIEKKPRRGRRERNPQAKLLERRVTRSRRWTALVGRRPFRRYSDARFWRKTRKYGQSGSPLLTDALAGTNAIVGLVERLTRRSHDESYGSTSSTGNEYQQNTIFWAKQQQQQHQRQ